MDNEDSVRRILKEWGTMPVSLQQKHISQAIQSLELSQMYYDQKGNLQGAARVELCIKIMKCRQEELCKHGTSGAAATS